MKDMFFVLFMLILAFTLFGVTVGKPFGTILVNTGEPLNVANVLVSTAHGK